MALTGTKKKPNYFENNHLLPKFTLWLRGCLLFQLFEERIEQNWIEQNRREYKGNTCSFHSLKGEAANAVCRVNKMVNSAEPGYDTSKFLCLLMEQALSTAFEIEKLALASCCLSKDIVHTCACKIRLIFLTKSITSTIISVSQRNFIITHQMGKKPLSTKKKFLKKSKQHIQHGEKQAHKYLNKHRKNKHTTENTWQARFNLQNKLLIPDICVLSSINI